MKFLDARSNTFPTTRAPSIDAALARLTFQTIAEDSSAERSGSLETFACLNQAPKLLMSSVTKQVVPIDQSTHKQAASTYQIRTTLSLSSTHPRIGVNTKTNGNQPNGGPSR